MVIFCPSAQLATTMLRLTQGDLIISCSAVPLITSAISAIKYIHLNSSTNPQSQLLQRFQVEQQQEHSLENLESHHFKKQI